MKELKMIGGLIAKNSTTLLTGLSVAGLISTVISAVRATPKALDIIETIPEDERDVKNVVKHTYKCYIPAVIFGTITVASIIGCNSISLKRHTAMVSAYKISEKLASTYREKVIDNIGVTKEKEIRDQINEDLLVANPVGDKSIFVTGNGDTLFYDSLSGRYFYSSRTDVERVLTRLSRDMLSETTVSLNQVYGDLGLDEVELGDLLGWHIDDGTIDPHITSKVASNGEPCLVLSYYTELRYQPW